MRIKIKKLLVLTLTALGMLVLAPSYAPAAHADLMQCPYPATGFQVRVDPVIGEAVGYVCDYPMERNRAHLHAEYGGYMTGGGTVAPNLGLGIGSFGFHVSVGMTMWSQSWRCPNMAYMAAPPNGIGAWNQPQDWTGTKCPATELSPFGKIIGAPWPPVDPDVVVVVNVISPPGTPDPAAVPAPNAPPLPPPAPDAVPGGLPVSPDDAGGTTNLNPAPTNPVPLFPTGR
jgi:hypothetical protein